MPHNSDGEELPDDWFHLKQKGGVDLLKKVYPKIWQQEEVRQAAKFNNQPHIRRAKMEHLELIAKRTQEEEEKQKMADAHHRSYLTQRAEAKDKRFKAKQINDMEEYAYWHSRIKSIDEEDRIWKIVNS
jgi:hypothetical protein